MRARPIHALRTATVTTVAVVAAMLAPAGAQAATWEPADTLATGVFARSGGMASLGGARVIAVVETGDKPTTIRTRRSVDGGQSWQPPVLVATGTDGFSAISGRAEAVDVVWRNGNGRLRYRRSIDGGLTYLAPTTLSGPGTFAWRPAVARGPNGLVVIVWGESGTPTLHYRVSTDGGATFDAARVLSRRFDDGAIDVVIARGVIHVGYQVGIEGVRVRRSLDGGDTWSAPFKVTDAAALDDVALAAAGTEVVVAYTTHNQTDFEFFRVRYRRSTDRGASWSAQRGLVPASMTTSRPAVDIHGGVIRAVVERCTTEFDICISERVLYTESSDGLTWTTPQRISPSGIGSAGDPTIAWARAIVVNYAGFDQDKVYARRGT